MSEEIKTEAPVEVKVESSVPRETFEKLLTEKKNYAEKTKELTAKIQELETARLKEKEDYKTMYELTLKEKQALENERAENKLKEVRGKKLSELTKELQKMGVKNPTTLESLLKLSDTESLKYDEENKIVFGVEEEAKRIKSAIPEVFGAVSVGASHDAPKGAPGSVTMDAYNKMINDGSFFKMSKEDQKALTAQVYNSVGIPMRR